MIIDYLTEDQLATLRAQTVASFNALTYAATSGPTPVPNNAGASKNPNAGTKTPGPQGNDNAGSKPNQGGESQPGPDPNESAIASLTPGQVIDNPDKTKYGGKRYITVDKNGKPYGVDSPRDALEDAAEGSDLDSQDFETDDQPTEKGVEPNGGEEGQPDPNKGGGEPSNSNDPTTNFREVTAEDIDAYFGQALDEINSMNVKPEDKVKVTIALSRLKGQYDRFKQKNNEATLAYKRRVDEAKVKYERKIAEIGLKAEAKSMDRAAAFTDSSDLLDQKQRNAKDLEETRTRENNARVDKKTQSAESIEKARTNESKQRAQDTAKEKKGVIDHQRQSRAKDKDEDLARKRELIKAQYDAKKELVDFTMSQQRELAKLKGQNALEQIKATQTAVKNIVGILGAVASIGRATRRR